MNHALTESFLRLFFRVVLCLPVFAVIAAAITSMPVRAAGDDEVDGDSPSSRYVEIQPAFVTNYGGEDRLRYMKVEVTLRVLGTAGEKQVNRHMPYIKDTLLSLFAIQTRESIGSAEGKESLRKASLQAVGKILEEEDKVSHVEDLLFTGFVAHR